MYFSRIHRNLGNVPLLGAADDWYAGSVATVSHECEVNQEICLRQLALDFTLYFDKSFFCYWADTQPKIKKVSNKRRRAHCCYLHSNLREAYSPVDRLQIQLPYLRYGGLVW
jgi:hypothetical protein